MGISVPINSERMKKVSRGSVAEPSELRELVNFTERLAVKVEQNWEDFNSEERKELMTVVYYAIEPPSGIWNKARSVVGAIRLGITKPSGTQDDFLDFLIARRRLLNAVTDAIEADDLQYHVDLASAVEHSLNNLENHESVTPERLRERLNELSDEALRDL